MSTGGVHLQCRLSYSADPQNEPISIIPQGCSAFPSPVPLPCATLSPCVMDGPGAGVKTFLEITSLVLASLRVFSVRLPFSAFTHDLL